jgi:hypothetical protein
MSVIFATQEAEIRRIAVRSQPGQIVCEILSRKNPSQKRAGGVTQGVGPEFKPQYHEKQTNKKVHLSDFLCVGFSLKKPPPSPGGKRLGIHTTFP